MEFDEIIKIHHGSDRGFCRHYLTLYSIVLGLETKLAFEFGTGFSTKVILEALCQTGGSLISCDCRPPGVSDINWKEMEEYKNRWRFIEGRSQEVLKSLKLRPLDFVLHDGAHNDEIVYDDLKLILPRMKTKSIILVHDVEHKYLKLRGAVESALQGVRSQRMILPYGCGLYVIRIDEDFGNGLVSLTWKKKK